MKKIIIMLIAICLVVLTGCDSAKTISNDQYLRIHIRANSNSALDQKVKYDVRDNVVQYMSQIICEVESKEQLQSVLLTNMVNIETIANQVLKGYGLEYQSRGHIGNEYFPTRQYDDVVLESDYYDAIILELGSGQGDNWWCVVYPPMCFVNAKEIDGNAIKYKSKILEIINKFFD